MHVECSACGARYVIADEKIPAQGARVRCRKCQAVFAVAKPEVPAPTELPLIPPSPPESPPAPPAAPGGAFLESVAPTAPPGGSPPAPAGSPADPAGPPPAPERAAPPDIERFAPSFAEHPPAVGVESFPRGEFTRGYEPGMSGPAPDAPPVREFSAPASGPAPPTQAAPASEPNPFASEPKPAAPEPRPTAPEPKPAAPRPTATEPRPPAQGSGPSAAEPSAAVGRFSATSGIPEGLPEAERLKHERARRLARVLASDIAIYNKEKRDRGIKDGNLVAVLGYEIKKSWEVYKERVTPEMANSTPYFRDALNEMLAEGKKIF